MDLGQRLKTAGLNKSCVLLIVLAGLERFAFKGVASNLVTYLTDVAKMSNSTAAKMVNSWCGFTSIVPLLVAPLVDSYWDRYSTVQAASLLYAMGLIVLTSTALGWPSILTSKLSSSSLLQLSLYLISLGQGGYNPSLQAFAADQFENQDQLPSNKADQSSSDKKRIFFQWWYFGVCCGSLLGVSLMSYIQDNLGWGLGFAIPAISFVASIAIFSCGNRLYKHKKKAKNVGNKPIENVIQNVKTTLSRIIKGKRNLNSSSKVAELELEDAPLCDEDLEGRMEGPYENTEDGNHLLQIAKAVLPLLPVWTMLLMFAVIFQQPATFFTKQGMTMKRNIGSRFKIPPAALQSAITISIILLMPLYDIFFIPMIRVLTRNEKGISVMQRMGFGMFLSIVAMVIAALTERKRLELCRNGRPSETTVPFSIFWLLPQYILLGISDIFTVVGMQEFFYSEVPLRMRTMGIALYTSVFGVGSFLSALLISLVEYFTSSSNGSDQHAGWFTDDMKNSRLDKYYWLLALLSAMSFTAFVIFSKLYTSRS